MNSGGVRGDFGCHPIISYYLGDLAENWRNDSVVLHYSFKIRSIFFTILILPMLFSG